MRRSRDLLVMVAALVAGCLGAPEPRIETGPGAVVTPDGLHKVEPVPVGTLFMRPDYAFGSYAKYILGETVITLKRDSRVLDPNELEELKARFDAVAREVIAQTGRVEVAEPAPCVALVNLALLDVDLLDPSEFSGARTSMVASFGSLTLALEVRDSSTGEPLLRYSRRRRLEGGAGIGADPATGAALSAALEKFAVDFQDDFVQSLPRVHIEPVTRVLTCAERAGMASYAPAEDARLEMEQALKLAPDVDNGRRIYAACAECHQPDGRGLPDGSVPQLAGQHREVVVKQLADIRAGNRYIPTMYAFASAERIGGVQAVSDVAGYVAAMETSADTGKGPGDDPDLGRELYERNCSRCHGLHAEGDGERRVPRIQAQHYAYLLRQFEWIRDGKRRNADPEMTAQIQGFSDREARAVLDYVSRLEPAGAMRPSALEP
jgi:cytochrome c553